MNTGDDAGFWEWLIGTSVTVGAGVWAMMARSLASFKAEMKEQDDALWQQLNETRAALSAANTKAAETFVTHEDARHWQQGLSGQITDLRQHVDAVMRDHNKLMLDAISRIGARNE